MSAFEGISNKSKIALAIAGAIMFIFFIFKTLVVFKYIHHSTFTHWFEYLSVIFFMPPFFYVVNEFLQNKAYVSAELKKKNIYLEHAAKIIRHDMHSGINTYLPRGISSLKRRLKQEDIDNIIHILEESYIDDSLFPTED